VTVLVWGLGTQTSRNIRGLHITRWVGHTLRRVSQFWVQIEKDSFLLFGFTYNPRKNATIRLFTATCLSIESIVTCLCFLCYKTTAKRCQMICYNWLREGRGRLLQWHACKLAKLGACIAKYMTTLNRIYICILHTVVGFKKWQIHIRNYFVTTESFVEDIRYFSTCSFGPYWAG